MFGKVRMRKKLSQVERRIIMINYNVEKVLKKEMKKLNSYDERRNKCEN